MARKLGDACFSCFVTRKLGGGMLFGFRGQETWKVHVIWVVYYLGFVARTLGECMLFWFRGQETCKVHVIWVPWSGNLESVCYSSFVARKLGEYITYVF